VISRGVPMFLGGDEFRRTQGGNNNAYCQDNEMSWYDWSCLEQHQEIYRFARGMISFRQSHPVLSKEEFYTDAEIRWFGSHGGLPNWADPHEKWLACLIQEGEHSGLYLMFNTGTEAVDFKLPPAPPGTRWHLAADTAGETPRDWFAKGAEPPLDNSQTYPLASHSSAILVVRPNERENKKL
jgi:isoamylase